MKWKYAILPAIAALIIIGIVVFAWLHIAQIPVLNPQGPVGLRERWVIGTTVLLCSIVVVPVFVILFAFAWKYRADNPDARREHAPNWDHDNWIAEAIWWFVPAVIIVCLSVIAWQTTHQLDPFKTLQGKAAPLTIEVVALDWKWLFIYPAQGIATVNMVEFPENTSVRFEVTTDAPMNQFWIPSLGGQVMAMPGMTNDLNLMATSIGTFHGLSSQISGDGFAGMQFTAKSVTPSDFAAWVQSAKEAQNPLTAASYAKLAQPSEYNPVSVYSPVDANLYSSIIMKYMTSSSTP